MLSLHIRTLVVYSSTSLLGTCWAVTVSLGEEEGEMLLTHLIGRWIDRRKADQLLFEHPENGSQRLFIAIP